jgi:hypothetical protein
MKLVGVISTAVLSLTLGVAAPAYAQQEQHDQQDEQKAKPAEEKKTQPEQAAKPEEKSAVPQDKTAKPEEKNAQQQDKTAKPEEKNAQSAEPAKPAQPVQSAAGGRIPADRFKANFGSEHTFRVTQTDYSNHRFEYGGYSFGFVDPWPSNWLYTQNVYVIDINGVYYLCNPVYPGVNIALSFTL